MIVCSVAAAFATRTECFNVVRMDGVLPTKARSAASIGRPVYSFHRRLKNVTSPSRSGGPDHLRDRLGQRPESFGRSRERLLHLALIGDVGIRPEPTDNPAACLSRIGRARLRCHRITPS